MFQATRQRNNRNAKQRTSTNTRDDNQENPRQQLRIAHPTSGHDIHGTAPPSDTMTRTNTAVIILVWITINVSVSELTKPLIHDSHDGVTLVSGSFWEELPPTIIYEATIPLIYESIWPSPPNISDQVDFTSFFCDHTGGTSCLSAQQIFNLNTQIRLLLVNIENSTGESNPITKNTDTILRTRRGLDFIGGAFQ